MKKESFILYNSFYEPIKALKNEQLGKLLRAIFDYTINGKITQETDILVAFMFIKNQIDLDTEKWLNEKNNRSEAGKKGMASRWHNKNNNLITNDNKDNNVINAITNITDNVNDNVNVNENDNVLDIYTYIEQNFGRTLSPIEYEQISQWKDTELTRYAIKQAVLNGKYNLKYINAILNNWEKNRITTVQDAQQEILNFKKPNIPEWLDKDIKQDIVSNEEEQEFLKKIKEIRDN